MPTCIALVCDTQSTAPLSLRSSSVSLLFHRDRPAGRGVCVWCACVCGVCVVCVCLWGVCGVVGWGGGRVCMSVWVCGCVRACGGDAADFFVRDGVAVAVVAAFVSAWPWLFSKTTRKRHRRLFKLPTAHLIYPTTPPQTDAPPPTPQQTLHVNKTASF